MCRWLFNIAAGFSLLLFVATCVMWVRSYWVASTCMYGDTDRFGNVILADWEVSSSNGTVTFAIPHWNVDLTEPTQTVAVKNFEYSESPVRPFDRNRWLSLMSRVDVDLPGILRG